MNTEWLNQLPVFLLVLIRVIAFFTSMPLFTYRTIPASFKVGLAIFFAFIMMFTLDAPSLEMNSTYILLIFKEMLVGLSIGLLAGMMVYAVQVAGMFLDIAFGFLVANVIDPQTGAQSPLMGGYLYTLTLLFLLAVDGHHLMMDGMYYSYQFIPIEQLTLPFGEEAVAQHVLSAFSTMFMIAFQMSFPIVGSLFLIDVALGMMSRAVPQMNVFVVGLPLKIFAGLPLLALTMPAFFMAADHLFDEMFTAMRTLMELFGGA
ncbi:flagellar biosynthetic protein FliR [Alteribacillus persepolensis]|uniref:Flagellar biosynthetic protein FliR n=1 Tax=Alteribacillus persepolensis TaxID=568899 RepID=A0A1G7YP67_9BACI|nr:flagellar biosynthetic protein FliR [Alteribacillus persepolensis]SDG98342.1 flagellar biosynthetic protein FliR [Alteribacillus persepolensis]